MIELEELRYPVGKFMRSPNFGNEQKLACIAELAALPEQVKKVTQTFDEKHWKATYREGGWTGIQLIHHLADAHLNGFCRFKFGITEEHPSVKAYEEKNWANTADGLLYPPFASLYLLQGLHERWVTLLESLSLDDLKREVYRPESDRDQPLSLLLEIYAWHCRHHVGHLKLLS